MCSNKYLPLWDLIKIRVFENHKISDYNYNHKDYEHICIKNRVAQIFILEIILNEYRKKHATLFASLSGRAALHHLIFSKTNWKLEYIRNLSLEDVLFIVSDELVIDKLPTEAKEFLNTCELSEKMITLDSSLEADWDSKEIEVYLARMR